MCQSTPEAMCQSVPEPVYRLRREAFALFASKEWPALKRFCRFARGKQCGLKGTLERDYPLLQQGLSVRRPTAVAMLEYARRKWSMPELRLEDIAMPDPYGPLERAYDIEMWDLAVMLGSVRKQFQDTSEMYFERPEADAHVASRSCMRTVGYLNAHPGDPVDEENCVARAERIMNRTPSDYANWLLRMHEFDYHTTAWFVAIRKGAVHRLGHCSMLPVTQEAFHKIAAGELAEMEINESHLCNPSQYVFIHGMAEPDACCTLSAEAVARAQARCLSYQVAYFTRGLRPLRPHIVTLAGSKKYAERLAQQGFRSTGKKLKGTDKDVVVLGPPRLLDGLRDNWHYFVLKTILKVFRFANRREWRRPQQG